MSLDYIKIWLINGTTLFISLQSIDYLLKFSLLFVSIGFTAAKWWQLVRKDPDTFRNPFDGNDEKDKDADNKEL